MSSSPAGFSDVEPPSSPANFNKSYLSSVAANDNEDSQMLDTPEPPDRYSRGGGGSRSRGSRGSVANGSVNGGGGSVNDGGGGSISNGMFKDPSTIGKIRHLKKEDGEPLWRSDIQYDFLRAVFDDEHRVFTNSYSNGDKQCFADLYIDTMARSTKTSKILHDKLLSDRNAAKSMAMVCLLVNIGRMNTTLNFFPEMRAQLRTYHAIPSLQVHQDAQSYKQLQDAPRLKSILKGGSEDRTEPKTLDQLKDKDVPRTNPVNLIFLICHNAAKVAELHFPPGLEFHDLIMKTDFSSKSRATAFLWIMWFYLESDFTEEGCEENPFGPGVDYGVDVANQGVPKLVELTPEEIEGENQDTPEEFEFGYTKKALRSSILRDEHLFHSDAPTHKRASRGAGRASTGGSASASASVSAATKEPAAAPLAPAESELSAATAILPRIRPSKHESDVDSTRSTPPPRALGRAGGGGHGSTASRRTGPLRHQIVDASSPVRQPPLLLQLQQQQQHQELSRKRRKQPLSLKQEQQDDDEADVTASTPAAQSRKPRPPTAHQIAVENNRKQRIKYLLSRGIHRKHHRARKARRTDGAIIRAIRRLDELADPFEDSEDEENTSFNRALFPPHLGSAQLPTGTGTSFREKGFGGLVQLSTEMEDFGEEVSAYASAMRRACRRINRWEGTGTSVVLPIKRQRVNMPARDEFRDPNETEEEVDLDDADMDASMLNAVATPPPAAAVSAKRRRPAASTGTPSSSRARGSKAGTAKGGVAKGGSTAANGTPTVSRSTLSRRRRAALQAAAAEKAALQLNGNGDGDGDVVMDDADDGDKVVVDSGTPSADVASASGAAKPGLDAKMETEGGDVAEVAAATPALSDAKRKVTIKRATSRSRSKHHGDDGDDAEVVRDEDEELDDMDRTLLGMRGGDSDSD